MSENTKPNNERPADLAVQDSVGGMARRLLNPAHLRDLAGRSVKTLREQAGLTQAEVARQLGISRAGVNAWEMGLSVPSTPYVVELAKKFGVSTDYLLGMEDTATISVKGLSQKQVTALMGIIECFKKE